MNLKIFLISACTLVNAASGDVVPTVVLGTAGNFVILAKTGISTVPKSVVTGNIGVSPIFSPAITGFNLAMNNDAYSTDRDADLQLIGQAFAANYGGTTETDLTTAVGAMQTAYTDAAGRANTDAAKKNLGEGLIGGLTLTPGVYTFGVNVQITGELTFDGQNDPNAVFIIQTTGNIIQAANTEVKLLNGAKAENIFWQVAGAVTVGAGAHLEGILLVKTGVTFVTGSTLNGRILAQTRVDLQKATITEKPVKVRRGLRGLQLA